MGVYKLWNILSSSGRQTNLDQLGKKRLAIDTSIWLNKFVKAMRDQQGNLVANAHIRGMVSRILKMLQYGIRPVFIFDGATPAIKKKTTMSRRKIREESETKLRKVAQQLLLNRIKQQAIQAKSAIGVEAARELEKQIEELAASSEVTPARPKPSASTKGGAIDVEAEGFDDFSQFLDEGEFDESFNATNASYVDEFEAIRNEITSKALEYAEDLIKMNIDQDVFASLPPRVQMEIIADIKKVKQAKTKALVRDGSFKSPSPSHFSEIQVQNLISSGDLTRKLIKAREAMANEAQPIASDPNAKYILIRTKDTSSNPSPSSTVQLTTTPVSDKSKDSLTTPSNTSVKSSESDKKRKTMSEPIVLDEEEVLLEDRRKKRRKSDPQMDYVKKKLDFAESDVILPQVAEDHELNITLEVPLVTLNDRLVSLTNPGAHRSTSPVVDVDNDGGFFHSDGENEDDRSAVVDLTTSPVKGSKLPIAKNIDDDESSVFSATEVSDHFNDDTVNKTNVRSAPIDVEEVFDDDESTDFVTLPSANFDHPIHSTPARAAIFSSTASNHGKSIDVSLFGKTQITVDLPDDAEEEVTKSILNDIKNYEEFLDEEERNALVISSGEEDDKSIYSVEDNDVEDIPLENEFMEDNEGENKEDQVEGSEQDLETKDSEEYKNTARKSSATSVVENSNVNTPPAVPKRNINDVLMANAGNQSVSTTAASARRDTRKASQSNPGNNGFMFSDSGSLSDAQVASLQREVRSESAMLYNQRQQLASAAQGVTDEMVSDCMEILGMFGIPYLVSATESDSQCAILEELGLVDGIITDDSDVFLFGAKNVYRHAFEYEKPVEVYSALQLENELGLTRKELICLAYLLGSDYTSGVKGIGVISAAEIIEEFCTLRDSKTVTAAEVVEDLNRFKAWLQSPNDAEHNDSDFKKRHKNLKSKIKLAEDFPNIEVAEAYINPQVDDSKDPFEWSVPNLDALRHYVVKKLDWPIDKANEKLMTVIQKYNSIVMNQSTLTSYFKPNVRIESKIKSERLSAALSDLATKRQEMKENKKSNNNNASVEKKKEDKSEKTPEKSAKATTPSSSTKKKSPASGKATKKSPRTKAKK